MNERTTWYGLKIKNISIIALPRNLVEGFSYLEFFVTLGRFLTQNTRLETLFGVFLDKNLRIRRQKIRENFREENLISILNDKNEGAYYSKIPEFEEFVEMGFKLHGLITEWFVKKIWEEKNKIFNS